eukprot:12889759-Prorocentrum_lima.AAC.1
MSMLSSMESSVSKADLRSDMEQASPRATEAKDKSETALSVKPFGHLAIFSANSASTSKVLDHLAILGNAMHQHLHRVGNDIHDQVSRIVGLREHAL